MTVGWFWRRVNVNPVLQYGCEFRQRYKKNICYNENTFKHLKQLLACKLEGKKNPQRVFVTYPLGRGRVLEKRKIQGRIQLKVISAHLRGFRSLFSWFSVLSCRREKCKPRRLCCVLVFCSRNWGKVVVESTGCLLLATRCLLDLRLAKCRVNQYIARIPFQRGGLLSILT